MKRLLLIIPAIVLIAAEPEKKPKTDLDKLQGEWIMTALEVDGVAVPSEKLEGSTLTIKDNKYIVTTKKSKHEVTIQLDESKDPKTIDMAFPDGANEAKIGKGIYKIDGDKFILVRAQSTENERPTSFGTWPNTGVFMVTWQRK
jgi:uncharacterized protein (TIGR03067 family)